MLRYLTAGESHGPELVAIMEGLPSGVPVSLKPPLNTVQNFTPASAQSWSASKTRAVDSTMPTSMNSGAMMAMNLLIWGSLVFFLWYAIRMKAAGVLH